MINTIRSGKVIRQALAACALLAGLSVGSTANAVTVVGPPATVSPCTNFTFSVTISACAGGYEGNLLQGSLTNPTGLAALTALGAPNSGTFLEPKLENLNSDTGVINFSTLLTGVTVFALHAGRAGDGGQGTFFFRFDAGAGVDSIAITDRLNSNATGLSNAALFQTGVSAVPEPATWAMMLIGFGAIGGSMRHRRRQTKVTHATA
jgi:hypothetical protein